MCVAMDIRVFATAFSTQDIKGWQLQDELHITNMATRHGQRLLPASYHRCPQNISIRFTNMYWAHPTQWSTTRLKHITTDTVTPASFAFETISAYIRSNQEKENKWAFTYFTRKNQLPFGKTLAQSDRSNNYNFQADLSRSQHHQLKLNVTYRQLYVNNVKLTSQLPDNSLLGPCRVQYK